MHNSTISEKQLIQIIVGRKNKEDTPFLLYLPFEKVTPDLLETLENKRNINWLNIGLVVTCDCEKEDACGYCLGFKTDNKYLSSEGIARKERYYLFNSIATRGEFGKEIKDKIVRCFYFHA